MPRNADPKHGRWILPLIIVAMIVLTITFVNSLEPAETEAGTTTTAATTTTAPTTTLPTDVTAFLQTLDVYETQLTAFRDDVATINAEWEAGGDFNNTVAAFEEVRAAVDVWEDEVAGAADVPSALAPGHVDLVLAVSELGPRVDAIITGLEAPDDGTLRRQAIIEFEDQVDAILAAIADLREQAQQTGTPGGEETTTTTNPGDEPTTSITTTSTTSA